MGYGQYCQIHEEDQPRISTAARTQGAILLGPSGNAQGSHRFYTLNIGKVVVQWAWTELPTPASVISRVHFMAKGMPAQPIFTDQAGQVIGDTEYEFLPNIDNGDVKTIVDDTIQFKECNTGGCCYCQDPRSGYGARRSTNVVC